MLFTIGKHYIRHDDSLYEVIRIYLEERIKSIDGIKECLNADIALRNNGRVYFCQKIQDAEIVTEQDMNLISE